MKPASPTNQQLIKNRSAFQNNAHLLWPYWVLLQQNLSCHIESHVQNLAFRSWTDVSHPHSATPLRIDPVGMICPDPHTWSMHYGLLINNRLYTPTVSDSTQAYSNNTHQTLWQCEGVTVRQSIATIPTLVSKADRGGAVVSLTVSRDRHDAAIQLVLIALPMHPEGLGSLQSICYLSNNTVMLNNTPQLVLHEKPAAITCFSQDESSVPDALSNWNMIPQVHCSHGLATACFSYTVDTNIHIMYTLPHGVRSSTKLPISAIQNQRFSDIQHTLNQVWTPIKQKNICLKTPDNLFNYTLKTGVHYLLQGHATIATDGTPISRWLLGRLYAQLGYCTHAQTLLKSVTQSSWWWHPSPDAAGIAVDLAYQQALYSQDFSWIQNHWSKLNKSIAHWVKRLQHQAPIPYPLLPLAPTHAHNQTSTPLLNHAWLIHAVRTLGHLSKTRGLPAHMDYSAVSQMLHTYLNESLAFIFDRRPDAPYLALSKTPKVHGKLLDTLYSLVPLGIFSLYQPLVNKTLSHIEQTFGHDGCVVNTGPHDGFSVRHNAQLAQIYFARGDTRKAHVIVKWLIETANTNGSFPTTVHTSTHKGGGGLGHDSVATAACVSVLLSMIAHADNTCLNLLFHMPNSVWEGSQFTGIPTPFGPLDCHLSPSTNPPYTLTLNPQFHTPPTAIVIQLHPSIQRVMAESPVPILDNHRIQVPATTHTIQCY